MKKILLVTLGLTINLNALASTLFAPTTDRISPAYAERVITLVNRNHSDGTNIKVKVVVQDNGMSTDLHPRFTVYLGILSRSEMGNIDGAWKIADVQDFLSAERLEAGIYKITTVEYGYQGFEKVTRTINASEAFDEEIDARKACKDDFCDKHLQKSLTVSETRVPMR